MVTEQNQAPQRSSRYFGLQQLHFLPSVPQALAGRWDLQSQPDMQSLNINRIYIIKILEPSPKITEPLFWHKSHHTFNTSSSVLHGQLLRMACHVLIPLPYCIKYEQYL